MFAYFSEFLSREKRGEHLSWLGIFWMAGGIYASAMAWSIIPHYGECRKLQRAGGPLIPDTCIRTAFPVLSLDPALSYTVPEYNLDLSKELPALEHIANFSTCLSGNNTVYPSSLPLSFSPFLSFI